MVSPVLVTPSAVKKVWALLEDEGDFSLKLRAYVTGGGCQGLQYGFAFESVMESDDHEFLYRWPHAKMYGFLAALSISQGCARGPGRLIDSGQVSLLIDPISFPYLSGSEIDYVADAHGERFVVRNPNAKTTCGCDRSFTPAN